jgi:SPP1 gp7 family putative phage head morphogenesis protein
VSNLKPLPGKPRTLAGIRANVGIQAAYRAELDALITAMQDDIVKTLTAKYRANTPELAMDKSPAAILNEAMGKLSRKWQAEFNRLGPKLAKHFATKTAKRSDASLKAALRKSGLTITFRMTRAMNDALQAVIAENVGLIKSIASEHLTDVQGILMRSVSRGGDLGQMSKELQKRYGLTKKRAALIARDQNSKVNSVIVRVRQQEAGITTAIWMHSTAGKHPRPTHVANNGKPYAIAEGWYDPAEGKKIWPGEAINCRCFSRAVIPGLS